MIRSRGPAIEEVSDAIVKRTELEGSGVTDCRSVKRVASAVGESATAIQLVHEYLRVGLV
jgi:hypothetical protein